MPDKLTNTNDLVDKTLDTSQEEGFSTLEQPDSDVVERFEGLVSSPAEKTATPESAPVNNIEAIEQPGLTLGDKVLQGMQGLRDQIEMKADFVKASIGPKDAGEALDMRKMFETQLAMTNLMVTEDYIGKIVSKSTQTFDTLLRNQ